MLLTRRSAIAALAALAFVSCAEEEGASEPATAETAVRVFAAASLTDILRMLGDHYAAAGNPPPVFNFAASSELARQIEQGAEADLFISADEAWMDYLAERDLIDPASRRTLLTNRLVLIAPADRPIAVALRPGLNLKAVLKGGRLAIANPRSVPAGKYARQALEHFGAWAGVEAETVRAENVRATLLFVERGEAVAGIVYSTDARAAGPAVQIAAEFPVESHSPITYPSALIAGQSGERGEAFLEFLWAPETKAAFESEGFGLP